MGDEVEMFLLDVRYGLRTLMKSPGFTLVSLVSTSMIVNDRNRRPSVN
jgi:hypothetical protein